MRSHNVFAALALCASCACAADNRIWSNAALGVFDPRASLPESVYTSCVFWASCNTDPARWSTWTVADGSKRQVSGVQTNATLRPVRITNTLAFSANEVNLGTNVAAWHISNQFTLALWIKTTNSTGSMCVAGNFTGINDGIGDSSTEWQCAIAASKPNVYVLKRNASAYRARTSSISVPSGAWTHLAASYDGSGSDGGIQFYVNGSLDSFPTNIGVAGTIASVSSRSNTLVGDRAFAGSPLYFTGSMDDLMMFNRVLTAQEVTNLFNATRSPIPARP
jgi:hypothetical protein